MRILALDLGEKTIGIAVSDPLGITAQGVKVLKRSGFKQDISRLRELIEEYAVEQIIIGYPLNMNGSAGNKAREAANFKKKLSDAVSLPVILWDERLTTVAAKRALLEAGIQRDERRKIIDKVAAVLILDSYLQRRVYMDELQGDREK